MKPALCSAAGLVRALALLTLAGGASQALAAAKAGEVTLLTGRGTATDQATANIRELAKGEPLFAGEVITTAVNSYLNIKFQDGSYVLLRPNSRFEIADYQYAEDAAPAPAAPPAEAPRPAPATPPRPAPPAAAPAPSGNRGSRAFFRLIKGGFRAVSGLIGKADPNEYRVSTPVATIGIRGTDYVAVICDAACARDPILRDELPQAAEAMEGGLIAGVIDGGIGVTSQAQSARAPAPITLTSATGWLGLVGAVQPTTTELGPNQYVAVQADGKQIPLTRMPGFLVRTPIPDPATICQQ